MYIHALVTSGLGVANSYRIQATRACVGRGILYKILFHKILFYGIDMV
jgi:hypothetical protein